MPIAWWRRLPASGTEVRGKITRLGRKSPRWGIIEQPGNISYVIVRGVIGVVAAVRNGPTVRSLEEPLILIIALDPKTTLMNALVMP